MIYPMRDYARAWYRGAEMASMFVAGDKVWESVKLFSPLTLFANGEQGAWFDPSDLGSMFQDAAGTIPATYGQPVGLILDKSKPVSGINLFNGFTNLASWTDNGDGSWSIDAAATNRTMGADGAVAAPMGAYLEWTFNLTGGPVYLTLRNTQTTLFSAGSHRAVVITNSNAVRVQAGAGIAATISDIRVREVPGNHASQATATARPTLMQDIEGRAYLQSDGVDDVLTGPWTLGWAAPAEVHWLGQNNAVSGSGIAGLGIQYEQSTTRFGTLVASNWALGAPTATGRDSLTTSDGNMSAVAVRGGRATDDLMVAYRDGVVLGSKVPSASLGTSQSGNLQIGHATYQSRFYGGVMIFRELTSAERAKLVDYFHGTSA